MDDFYVCIWIYEYIRTYLILVFLYKWHYIRLVRIEEYEVLAVYYL